MQRRSRMAAWIVAAVACGLGGFPASAVAAGPAPLKQKVILKVRIDGTTSGSGTEVVIKPGHPSSRFKTMTYSIREDGWITDILPLDIETLSADRDCSFMIVLKEPGQPDRVFRRSFQITPPTEATANKPQVLMCYLSQKGISSKVAPAASQPIATKPTPGATRKR